MPTHAFPPDFLWGAASASFQIEGSPVADGAGESIWHRYVHTPGNTEYGDTGDVACDHYHRWPEDVALMKQLGLRAYRFSLSWGRLLPEGVGRVNQPGIDFYSRLVDALFEAGIAPMVTLFHWDYPQALQDRGGWLERGSAAWFAEYAETAFRALGDRVSLWLTLNEPEVFTECGFRSGSHAPGMKDFGASIVAGHNLIRGHGMAVDRFRAVVPNGQIGVAYALGPALPAEDTPAARAACRRQGAYDRRFIDPVQLGEYPPRLVRMLGDRMPTGWEDDLDQISRPTDLIGVNYYGKWKVTDAPDAGPENPMRTKWVRSFVVPEGQSSGFHDGDVPPVSIDGAPITPMGWPIRPEGLCRTLRWLKKRYGDLDQYVTENGAAGPDRPGPDGKVHDAYRIDYLHRHFIAAAPAIAAGCPLKGYMVWSLMDNLEWAAGYRVRMGLLGIDFDTLERRIKDSGDWYAGVIRRNGVDDITG